MEDGSNDRFRYWQVEQGSPEWEALHDYNCTDINITASMAASCVGVGFETPMRVYRRFLEHNPEKKLAKVSEPMLYGSRNELNALMAFGRLHPERYLYTRPGTIVSSKFDWLMASIDALLVDRTTKQLINLELKCPFSLRIPDEVPEKYYVQCQLQMYCLGPEVRTTFLFFWTPRGETKTFLIPYDKPYVERLLRALLEFRVCVDEETPPTWKRRI